MDCKQHFVSDPEVLRGKPRLIGTCIPVNLILDYLASGKFSAVIIGNFLT